MTIEKSPLNNEELRDIVDLSLFAGQLLLQHGAETARIEETVHRLGTGLGCSWMDILVSPNALVVTTISGIEFRTKVRRVVSLGVNMSVLTDINDLSRRVTNGEIDRFEAQTELRRISEAGHHYNRLVVVLMVGFACASFSRLLGGDIPVFVVTLLAASTAMYVRQELNRHYFNPLLTTIVTAFVAGIVASIAPRLALGAQPQLALASAVLLLVPGVPLINAAEDLIKGHIVTGIVRGFIGGLISLCIALGLLLAMTLTGVNTL